ncbi:MAG: hypothetical protein HY456_00585 [Parcubacteria group bacterium]|nr:hypothetical protein [Parcubacteria group bacterium]
MEYCPYCGTKTIPDAYFCQNCGKKLQERPLSGSFGKQAAIYLVSFFIPPLGFTRGYPYLKQKDKKLRIIGVVAMLLTVISLAVGIWLAVQIANSINQQINSLGNLGL